jgi:hypothetical protein
MQRCLTVPRAMFAPACLLIVLSGMFCPPRAIALEVFFQWGTGSLSIIDNVSIFDTDPNANIIKFGPIILPDYTVAGEVDIGSGPNLTSVIGNPSASIRLTNFTAEATTVPQFPLRVGLRNPLTGTYSNLVGGDSIDAYVEHAFGSPIPAGQDELQFWQGYLGLFKFSPPFGPNPPIPNPAVPANSPLLPYPTYGHGPYALPGTFTNPLLGADLYFYLGGQGDRFVLLNSAEVGFRIVPEPPAGVLAAIAAFGALGLRARVVVRNPVRRPASSARQVPPDIAPVPVRRFR